MCLMKFLLPVATTAMITEKQSFSYFQGDHCFKNKFFVQNNATYQSKLALKNGIKQIKNSQEKLPSKYIFSLAMRQTPTAGSKHVIFFFNFCFHLSCTRLVFICCLTWPIFLKTHLLTGWTFLVHTIIILTF